MAYDHDERLSHIESGFAKLQATQDAQGRELGLIRNEVSSIAEEVRSGFAAQAEKRNYDSRTNWPVLLSAITILIALGGIVSSNINKSIESQGDHLRTEIELNRQIGDSEIQNLKQLMEIKNGRGS